MNILIKSIIFGFFLVAFGVVLYFTSKVSPLLNSFSFYITFGVLMLLSYLIIRLIDRSKRTIKHKYYISSQIKSTTHYYKRGRRLIKDGNEKSFFENGSINISRKYNLGHLDGKELIYNKEGILIEENNYKFNKPEGLQLKFDETGSNTKKLIYKEGLLIGEFKGDN